MATDHQLSHKSYWTGVITIVITVLTGLLSAAFLVGSTFKSVENIAVRVDKIETRQNKSAERERESNASMNELILNLKFFMESKGVKYQEVK